MTKEEKGVWLWRSVSSSFSSHEDASIRTEQNGKTYLAAEVFFERCLGGHWRTAAPVSLNGEEVAELLWPFNEVFRPRLSEVKMVAYDPRFEAAADRAIDDLATTMDIEVLRRGPAELVRVLYERHTQLVVLAMTNQVAGDPVFTTLPSGLSPDQQRVGLVLLWIRGMQLPWPPAGNESSES